MSCTVGCFSSQEAKLSADLSERRSIGRRVSRSTKIDPYRWPLRQAQSPTPINLGRGLSGTRALFIVRSTVSGLVGIQAVSLIGIQLRRLGHTPRSEWSRRIATSADYVLESLWALAPRMSCGCNFDGGIETASPPHAVRRLCPEREDHATHANTGYEWLAMIVARWATGQPGTWSGANTNDIFLEFD